MKSEKIIKELKEGCISHLKGCGYKDVNENNIMTEYGAFFKSMLEDIDCHLIEQSEIMENINILIKEIEKNES